MSADEPEAVSPEYFAEQKARFGGAMTVLSELVSFAGGPGGLIGKSAEKVLARRRALAADTFLAELRSGERDLDADIVEHIDEAAAMMLRFLRAADEGAREKNLRLLARVYRRHFEAGGADPHRFKQTAAVIEDLNQDEMHLIGLWLHHGEHSLLDVLRKAYGEEADKREAFLLAAGLTRFGIVELASAWGGMAYLLTPAAKGLLQELEAKDLMRSEPDAGVSEG